MLDKIAGGLPCWLDETESLASPKTRRESSQVGISGDELMMTRWASLLKQIVIKGFQFRCMSAGGEKMRTQIKTITVAVELIY